MLNLGLMVAVVLIACAMCFYAGKLYGSKVDRTWRFREGFAFPSHWSEKEIAHAASEILSKRKKEIEWRRKGAPPRSGSSGRSRASSRRA